MNALPTPTEMAMRDELKRIKIEQGEALKHVVEQDPKVYSESFTFRLRQWKNTQFAGLWELSVMDKSGRRVDQQITDADALTTCLDNIGAILESRGF